MAAERRVIDIDDEPPLVRLVDEVKESQESRVLRKAGEEVAVITPLNVRPKRQKRRGVAQEDIQRTLSAFGAWEGLIDVDQFLKDIYADRDADIRPPIEL